MLPSDAIACIFKQLQSVKEQLSDATVFMRPQIESAIKEMEILLDCGNQIRSKLEEALSMFAPVAIQVGVSKESVREALKKRIGWKDEFERFVELFVAEQLDIKYLTGELNVEELNNDIEDGAPFGLKTAWRKVWLHLRPK